ncbi:FKBP-type peptidyl-prolyl cis-trans isomerase [Sandaracinobacteroides sp. A072]|uniref:FKBP-type peptidyl-prolyl cis-trans isomerase n=1 Tax=Sandaracinobacteroides sp. A072 TaxID=3461146 RepID=UPI004041F6E8
MASDTKQGYGLGKWVVAGLVLAIGAVGLSLVGTEPLRAPARDARDFLAANQEKPGVKTTESGLQVEMLAAGEGDSPRADDTVLVHYEGRLKDGTVFDSSYQRGQPAVFGVGDVIPGWTEGLQLMRPGGKARFTIPPELGYGARGAGGVIPPNAVLVFDVELLAIAPRE